MKAMTIRMPNELYEQLRLVAFKKRESMNQLIVEALTQALTQQGES